jgi:uncharacterized protein YndB with AHSA1/START domain
MNDRSIAFRLYHTASLFAVLPLCGCHLLECHKTEFATPVTARDDCQKVEVDRPAASTPPPRGGFMSSIHLVRDYPHPPAKLWRVLTDPALMARWALKVRPEGFSTAVGTHFRLIGKPQVGWSGVIDCEVLEAREPSVLRYSWVADGGDMLQLTYGLEPHNGGTRFTFDQTGFKGIGGFLLAKLVMTPVRKEMFGVRIPSLLNDLDH